MTISTRSADRPRFDPDTPEFHADPYPTYQRLRAEAPVAWSERYKFWFLSRHADVAAAFHHPHLGHGVKRVVPGEALVIPEGQAALTDASARWLLFKDPPDHTRMRRLMNQAFASLSFPILAERTNGFVDELLAPMLERGTTELIADFAFPLPMLTMATALGVPAEDHPLLLAWARDLWGLLDLDPDEDAFRRASDWAEVVQTYFRALAADRNASLTGDLLSAMLTARAGEDRLSEDDVVANCALMLFAGHDTTAHLLGNGMLALVSHPEQLRQMRNDPEIDDAVVTELLRYNSPQQLAFRNALEDVVLGGIEIPCGDKVCLGIGAANRDPSAFPEPDRLSFDRPRSNHLAFAAGIHSCIGARIARQTARIALRRIVSRADEIHLRDHQWEPSILIRGLHRLHLDLG